MENQDKSVFISYRPPSLMRALAVSQNLSAQGYDVYFDHSSSNSGEAKPANLEQIKARAHFIAILTLTALDPCDDSNDPLRREIETALENRCNIVSLLYDGASFSHPALKRHLVGRMADLTKHSMVSVDKDKFRDAINMLCTYLDVPTRSAWAHSAVGQILKEFPKTEDTEKDDTQEESGLTAKEWFARGDKASDLDEKIRCFTAAIRIQPDYFDVYSNRALALQAKGNNDEALRDLTRCIELRPHSAIAYNNRGEFLGSISELESAIQDYDEAIRLQPNFAIAYNNRGETRQSLNDLDGAIQDFNHAIELDPACAEFYANRGSALRDNSEAISALADCNTAIRLKPDLAGAYTNRGGVLLDARDFDGAINDFSMAIHLEQSIAPHYYNRGLAYHQRGIAYKQKDDLSRAMADYNEALRLQPDHFGASINRAAIRSLLGDLNAAISDYDEIVQAYPHYGRAYKDRAYAYIMKQELMPAISDLQIYLDLGGIQQHEREEIENLLATLRSRV